jgi:hypothetical protein
MTTDPNAPATKEDVGLIMERFGQIDLKIADMDSQMVEWRQEMIEWKEETKRHFDLVIEHAIHEFVHGALADKVSQHDDRIVILEKRVFRR